MATTTTEFDLDYEFPDLDYDLRYLSLAGIDALTAFQNLLPDAAMTSFSACGLIDPHCSQNLTPMHSTITATIDSQSTICATSNVGSPISANKPEGRENRTKGATSGSSEPSDEDDEAGACEQSTNPADMKRLRRFLIATLLEGQEEESKRNCLSLSCRLKNSKWKMQPYTSSSRMLVNIFVRLIRIIEC
uniref:BZIP transcription factor 61 n=1 Tax=Glycine max TaxID=3847 RepID=A0A0R0K5M3_SOYBN